MDGNKTGVVGQKESVCCKSYEFIEYIKRKNFDRKRSENELTNARRQMLSFSEEVARDGFIYEGCDMSFSFFSEMADIITRHLNVSPKEFYFFTDDFKGFDDFIREFKSMFSICENAYFKTDDTGAKIIIVNGITYYIFLGLHYGHKLIIHKETLCAKNSILISEKPFIDEKK